MRPLTVAERALLDGARHPSERLVIRDFYRYLDARLVADSAAQQEQSCAKPPPPLAEPLFRLPRRDAA